MTRFAILLSLVLSLLISGGRAHAHRLVDTAFATVHTHSGFRSPATLTIDVDGDLYVAAEGQHDIVELSPSGSLLHRIQIPGNCWVSSTAIASSGALYAVSYCKGTVYEISASGRILQAFGKPATFDAQFRHDPSAAVGPSGIAVDHEGHVFVTYCGWGETGSSIQEFSAAGHRMRVMDRGVLSCPYTVSIDREGYLYVGNANGLAALSPSGTITGAWGKGAIGLAMIDQVSQSAVDNRGDVYVADNGNGGLAGVVMRFSSRGKFLGNVIHHGYTPGRVIQPTGVAIDQIGNIYVADWMANRISKFTSTGKLLAVWQP